MAESSAMRRIVTGFLLLVLIVPASAARQPVRARHGMVVAMESIAADVGVSVLQKGGNAVDAATVRGFELALSKYGRRKWAELVAPAIELASKGFPVSYAFAESLKGSKGLAASPESKRIFQKNGAFFDVGETLAQPELARTLERISTNGAKEFYEGDTARRFAQEMATNGGIITLSDLKGYRAIERTPLEGKYRDYTIITAPPSSSGGLALLEMLGILEGTGYEKGGAGSASAIHYAAEAMRRAYADRNEYVGDPDFVKVPIAGLLDRAYLAKLRASIDPARATPSDAVRPGRPAGTE